MAWRDFRQKPVVKCRCCGRIQSRGVWWPLRRRGRGVRMRGAWYCQADCLQWALSEVLGREPPGSRREAVVSHRVPLGLLLLSRQQLSAAQLRTALDLQRASGEGRIGDWLRHLGFASELQITAAVARQWACPVLKTSPSAFAAGRFVALPNFLLESFQMIPVGFAEATRTLLIAFSESIDHTMLYAVEQMLGYRTEACFVCPSILQKGLQALGQRHAAKDVVFDRLEDAGECARIIGSYAAKVAAEEVRLAPCGQHIWIRLEGRQREPVNLVLRSPGAASSPAVPPLWHLPAAAV
ncbi:MAG: hypothetical protein WB538_19255 [Candidatus Sulfotelmatobacter sp.]